MTEWANGGSEAARRALITEVENMRQELSEKEKKIRSDPRFLEQLSPNERAQMELYSISRKLDGEATSQPKASYDEILLAKAAEYDSFSSCSLKSAANAPRKIASRPTYRVAVGPDSGTIAPR
jgi:hypothetical protein